ncbi:MAG TPA: tetratricopeptide repeat protein, partial [Candidatus Saccharimonadia bacterium]|nr:tetratricopeptide repeat protein [Candidatus Saccharimonadia bacterium]
WVRKAADQGFAPAQSNLGVLYRNGDGVTRDDAQAAAWYQKAAQQGNAVAQYNLACCYEDGIGVPKDLIEAFRLYALAEKNGDRVAQVGLKLVKTKMKSAQIAEAERRVSAPATPVP